MAQITGVATIWNAPNYQGELFSADASATPFFSTIGDMTGGRQTNQNEFATSVLFDLPTAAQPAITETASLTAPAGMALVRSQETNVTQIHQEVIEISYVKMSSAGRVSGIGGVDTTDEMAFQIEQRIAKIARDVEYSFINGKYAKPTSAAVAGKTRGMAELTAANAVDAGSKPLTKALMNSLFKGMADRGAYFRDIMLFVPADVKQAISALYGESLPQSRNEAGINITELETDFCRAKVVWNRFMPAGSILVADVAYVTPVFQEVPGKGVFFVEDLAKTGAANRVQLFGQIGLAHGPAFLHGWMKGIAE